MISFFVKYFERLIQLPVNPESIEITSNSSNTVTDTIGMGEVNSIGFQKLKELSISSFFPKRYNREMYIHTGGQFNEPQFYIDLFEEIKKSRQPFRLIITELDINMLVCIEEFKVKYEYGTDDVTYTLSLKEFKRMQIQTLSNLSNIELNKIFSLSRNGNGTSIERDNNRKPPKTYLVQPGDSLWQIARIIYGDGQRWSDIYNYANNKEIIGGNPNLIHPGQVLTIPE